MPFAGDAPNVLKYIAADERSGNGDPGEADLELWIVTDYVEKGTSHFFSNLQVECSLLRGINCEMLNSKAFESRIKCCSLESLLTIYF